MYVIKGGVQCKKLVSSKYHQNWYTRFTSVDYPSLAFVATAEAILVVFQTCRFTHTWFILVTAVTMAHALYTHVTPVEAYARYIAIYAYAYARTSQDPTSRDNFFAALRIAEAKVPV